TPRCNPMPSSFAVGAHVSPQERSPSARQPKQQYAAPARPACPLPVIGPPQWEQVDMVASLEEQRPARAVAFTARAYRYSEDFLLALECRQVKFRSLLLVVGFRRCRRCRTGVRVRQRDLQQLVLAHWLRAVGLAAALLRAGGLHLLGGDRRLRVVGVGLVRP